MSIKDVINRALRAGIGSVGEQKLSSYSCPSFSMGMPREIDLKHAIDLFDALQTMTVNFVGVRAIIEIEDRVRRAGHRRSPQREPGAEPHNDH